MSDLFPEDPSLSLFSSRFMDQGFDPSSIRPIVSPSQTRPKTVPSIETTVSDIDQVIQQATQGSQSVISPKRPLPLDDSDTESGRAQKFQRAASPLKGAAGRKLDQQKRGQQLPVDPPLFTPPQHTGPPHPLPPPPLPRDVTFLLSVIPGSDKYTATRFKPSELVSVPSLPLLLPSTNTWKHQVRLIRETTIPTNVNQLAQPGAAGRGPPVHPPQLQNHMPQPPLHHNPPVMQQRPPIPPMPAVPLMQYGQYGQSNSQFPGKHAPSPNDMFFIIWPW